MADKQDAQPSRQRRSALETSHETLMITPLRRARPVLSSRPKAAMDRSMLSPVTEERTTPFRARIGPSRPQVTRIHLKSMHQEESTTDGSPAAATHRSTTDTGETPSKREKRMDTSATPCSSANTTRTSNQSDHVTPLCSPDDKHAQSREKVQARQHRYRILQEVVETEKTYVQGIETMLVHFKVPLVTSTAISLDDAQRLFPKSLDKLLESHKQLLEQLETRFRVWPKNTDSHDAVVGDVFGRGLASQAFFQQYSDYAAEFIESMQHLAKLTRTNGNYVEFHDDIVRLKPGRLDLAAYLLTPIQRLPRYILLITELIKVTPDGHPDRQQLSSALDKIKVLMSQLNESITKGQQLADAFQRQGKAKRAQPKAKKKRRPMSLTSTLNIMAEFERQRETGGSNGSEEERAASRPSSSSPHVAASSSSSSLSAKRRTSYSDTTTTGPVDPRRIGTMSSRWSTGAVATRTVSSGAKRMSPGNDDEEVSKKHAGTSSHHRRGRPFTFKFGPMLRDRDSKQSASTYSSAHTTTASAANSTTTTSSSSHGHSSTNSSWWPRVRSSSMGKAAAGTAAQTARGEGLGTRIGKLPTGQRKALPTPPAAAAAAPPSACARPAAVSVEEALAEDRGKRLAAGPCAPRRESNSSSRSSTHLGDGAEENRPEALVSKQRTKGRAGRRGQQPLQSISNVMARRHSQGHQTAKEQLKHAQHRHHHHHHHQQQQQLEQQQQHGVGKGTIGRPFEFRHVQTGALGLEALKDSPRQTTNAMLRAIRADAKECQQTEGESVRAVTCQAAAGHGTERTWGQQQEQQKQQQQQQQQRWRQAEGGHVVHVAEAGVQPGNHATSTNSSLISSKLSSTSSSLTASPMVHLFRKPGRRGASPMGTTAPLNVAAQPQLKSRQQQRRQRQLPQPMRSRTGSTGSTGSVGSGARPRKTAHAQVRKRVQRQGQQYDSPRHYSSSARTRPDYSGMLVVEEVGEHDCLETKSLQFDGRRHAGRARQGRRDVAAIPGATALVASRSSSVSGRSHEGKEEAGDASEDSVRVTLI